MCVLVKKDRKSTFLVLKNFFFSKLGNDEIAIYVTDMDDELIKKRLPRPPADSSRGMLRSKIECGMGTVPLSPKIHLQTWDGVMSGDRLLTMACSDKILRWNVVGMSLSLLGNLQMFYRLFCLYQIFFIQICNIFYK